MLNNEGENYIRTYPKLEKWINTCHGCGFRGYKPKMPEKIYPWFNVAAGNIRKLFEPLPLDEDGFCDQCSKHKQRKR